MMRLILFLVMLFVCTFDGWAQPGPSKSGGYTVRKHGEPPPPRLCIREPDATSHGNRYPLITVPGEYTCPPGYQELEKK